MKQSHCIECGIYLEKGKKNDKWCSMECKEKTFIECFETSQWTYRLIEAAKRVQKVKDVKGGNNE